MTYDNDNIFAKILREEIPCEKVYEDDNVLAFNDISKAAPVHILVIPKNAYTCFADFSTKATGEEIATFFKTIDKIAAEQDLDDGFRLITNNGKNASQTVPHFHVHILGGRALGGLLPDDKLVR